VKKVTFRLTVAQFQTMLAVVLSDEMPDRLTDLILMACTRPRDGVISVPVPPDDAVAIAAAIRQQRDLAEPIGAISDLLDRQLGETDDLSRA
jgi:hypothetical protein